LQGSQATTARFLEDVFVVPLETDLDLLAFDRPWEDYRAARERGRTDADRHLRFMLDAKPDRIRRELVAIRAATLAAINQGRAAKGKEPVDQLRVNLIRPFGRQSLQVVESVGMEADADDRLLLDRRGRGAAESFTSRELRVFRLGPRHNDRSREYMTKYERALVRSTVKTVMCVPIFEDLDAWAKEAAERPEPAGVLAIDSDVALAPEFEDDNLKAMLVSQGAVLYEAVSSEV
jgi:NTE family protein